MIDIPAKVADQALVAQRRRELLDAVRDLLLRKSIHELSVREIAEAAGWRMSTLYLYISRKEDILFLFGAQIIDEVAAGVAAIPDDDDVDRALFLVLERLVLTMERLQREYRMLMRDATSLLPEHREESDRREMEIVARIEAIVERGVAAGEFVPIEPRMVAFDLIAFAAMWALRRWILRPEMAIDEYIAFQHGVMMARLRTEPAERGAHPVAAGRGMLIPR